MTDSTTGFILCLSVFLLQIGLSYFITAACIDGVFPRRDIMFFPLVILTIAVVLGYTLRKVLDLEIEANLGQLRNLASLYSTCLGAFLGICAASVVRRRKLIRLAAEEREERQFGAYAT